MKLKETFTPAGRTCLAVYFSSLLPLLFIVLAFSNITAFLSLNIFHNNFLDAAFTGLTKLGDGLFILMAATFFLIIKKYRKMGISIIWSFLVSGLLAQLLKNTIHRPRPMILFQQIQFKYPYFIDGVTNSGMNSFPSGHTTSIFAICTLLALHSKPMGMQFLLISLAILVGYSRIYLGSHFPIDVLAGAILGGATSFMIYRLRFRPEDHCLHFTNKGPLTVANPSQAA